MNVTKGLNHLLKSPFSVHPKTGRVCVPFLAKDVDSFDPFIVPVSFKFALIIDVLYLQINDNEMIHRPFGMFDVSIER